MNEPTPAPRRRYARTHAEYRWTGPKVLAFLRALAVMQSVAKAARSVGMSRQSAYRLRARRGAEFAQVWDEGLALGRAMRGAGGGPGVQGDASGCAR